MQNENSKSRFAPELYIKSGIYDIRFYEKAFGALELRKWTNEDGSLHIAELSIDDAVFYVHEEKITAGQFNPQDMKGTTVLIGLFVSDVDKVMASAIDAGAILVSAARDYDYGYRQGHVKDPFGHVWMIQKRI